MIRCLAYVDDLLIISKTANELQRTLQTLESFCTTWQMTVNTDLSEVYHISEEKEIYRNEIFHFVQCS